MKLIGGIIAWLGGMALLLGILFFLMSMKNSADLFVWTFIGLIAGAFGIILLIIGGAIHHSGKLHDRNQENS